MSTLFNPGYAASTELRELGIGSVGANVHIARNCTIIGYERLKIGDNVRIDGPTTILVGSSSELMIGSFVHISAGCHLAASVPLEMADFAGLSQGVRIFTATDDYSGETLTNPMVPRAYKKVQSGPVRLGRHVIVGTGSVILPGVNIGDGTSVGAMSLVTKSLPQWSLCMGTPCRPVRERMRTLLELEKKLFEDIAAGSTSLPRP
ncbi:acyltransferase [Sulfitobacter sp. 1A12779]|uniref:acyltransferase n=1 Tax=Sulfitobacter sp. 1A12779 TaxID=3368599 RepID=UPI0037471E74